MTKNRQIRIEGLHVKRMRDLVQNYRFVENDESQS